MIDADLIHRALANPLRRDILAWLKAPGEAFPQGHVDFGRGVPVNTILARTGLSQSTVSVHVAVLVQAKLLRSTRVGQWTFLSRDEDAIRAFAEHVRRHL